jgi:hypothetical protein
VRTSTSLPAVVEEARARLEHQSALVIVAFGDFCQAFLERITLSPVHPLAGHLDILLDGQSDELPE